MTIYLLNKLVYIYLYLSFLFILIKKAKTL